jgi:hypothetical protein
VVAPNTTRTRMRPHSSQRTTASGAAALIAATSAGGRSMRQPSQRLPFSTAAPVPPSCVRIFSYSVISALSSPSALVSRSPATTWTCASMSAQPASRSASTFVFSATSSSLAVSTLASVSSCASSRSMTSSSISSSAAWRAASDLSSSVSATASLALTPPESSRCRSRSARLRTCSTSFSALVSSRFRSATRVRDSMSDVRRSAIRPSSSVSFASAGRLLRWWASC